MTDAQRPDDAPEPSPPSPASPYGPADSVRVTRARRTLGRLALVLPIAGLVLSVVALAVQVATGGAFGVDPLSEIAGFTLTFLGPTLLVLGLHMLVWRAMVRSLSQMTPTNRAVTIVGVGGILSLASVVLVFCLVFIGFMLLSLLFSATDQAM